MAKVIVELEELCRRCGIDALYTFGSQDQEVLHRIGSDSANLPAAEMTIGAQVARDNRFSAIRKAGVEVELADLLGAERVNLVILQEAGPFQALEIIRGRTLCCVDSESRSEFELYVLRRAADLANFEQTRRREILELEGAG